MAQRPIVFTKVVPGPSIHTATTFFGAYCGDAVCVVLNVTLSRASSPTGLLVLTNVSPDYLQRLPQIQNPAFMFHSDYTWTYFGFPLSPFKDFALSKRFTACLKGPEANGGKPPGYLPGRINDLSSLLGTSTR